MHIANKGFVQMTNRRLAQIERRIEKIKAELAGMGEMRPGSLTRQYKACLSGLLPMRYSDAKFRPWIPVVSRRRSQNFSGYSPMTRPAQDTLSSCGGRRGLRVPSAEILMSRTVLPSEERSYCGAALAIPISRLRLAPSCNRAIRRCLHGSGARTW